MTDFERGMRSGFKHGFVVGAAIVGLVWVNVSLAKAATTTGTATATVVDLSNCIINQQTKETICQ